MTPLVKIDEDLFVLELFHGPTFAFKDVALQLLGNLFEFFLKRRNEGKKGEERERLTVVGATSGDTGRYVSFISFVSCMSYSVSMCVHGCLQRRHLWTSW